MRRILLITLAVCLTFMLCLSSAFAEKELNIWYINEDCRFYYAEQKLNERYPDVTVTLEWADDSRTFINQLFARDPSIDIVGIQDWNNGISGRFLIRSGVLENLNQYDNLRKIREEYNALNDLYVLEDEWFGVHSQQLIWLWYGNCSLFAELGIEIPSSAWTWDDFYDMGKQVYQYNQEHGTNYKLIYEEDMAPYVIKQYLYNTSDYAEGTHELADPRFRELVEQWLQMREWGVCMDVDDDNSERRDQGMALPDTLIKVARKSFHTGGVVDVDADIAADDARAVYQLLIPPAEQGMHAALVRQFGMGVVSYSDLKEEALYFLECYMSKEAYLSAESMGLLNWHIKNMNGVCSPFMNNGPLYKDDPMLEKVTVPEGSWAEENLSTWISLIADCEGEYYDPDMAHTVCYDNTDGLRALKEGKISLDEYIDNCCRIADQYLGE